MSATTKLVREGQYVAEVEVELIEEPEWSAEIERRARAAINGEPGVPWEEVLATAKRRFGIE